MARELIYDVCLGTQQDKEVYIEVFTGFSHIFSPDDLNTPYSLDAVSLERAASVGIVAKMYIPRMGKGRG